MVAIKPADADRFVDKPNGQFRLFLLFGPDAGLISERADQIAKSSGVDLDDPFSNIRIDADTVAADSARLADEAHTVPMFGGKRLIRISGSTRRNLALCVVPVLDHPPQDCWIIIESGDLKRDAALRKAFEKSHNGAAIACYGDGPRELARLIDAELGSAGLAVEPDARILLSGQLGGDRQASRNELRKLALYCLGRKIVTIGDVQAIAGDIAVMEIGEVLDAATTGNVAAMHKGLSRLLTAGTAPDMIMLNALRHFQLMQQLRHQLEHHRAPVKTLLSQIRPPLHFSRKQALETSIPVWDANAISRALSRMDQAAFECRAKPSLGPSLAGTALLAIAVEARRKINYRHGDIRQD